MATNIGMESPLSLSGMSVSTGLLQYAHQNQLHMEAVKEDIIYNNKDLIKPLVVGDKDPIGNHNAFFLDVTPKENHYRSITLAFLRALNGAPVEGNVQFISNEMTHRMKWMEFHANDWAGGVTLQKFGIDAREKSAYKINEQTMKLLYQWRTEILGKYVREAFCQKMSSNLTAAPISLTQGINNNWYIPSIPSASQPAYDATSATHVTNVGTQMVAAGLNSTLTIPRMLDMAQYLEESYLPPVSIAGKRLWKMAVSPIQMRRMKDPSITNSWGAHWQTVAAVQDIQRIIPYGDFIFDNKIVICEDVRCPTIAFR